MRHCPTIRVTYSNNIMTCVTRDLFQPALGFKSMPTTGTLILLPMNLPLTVCSYVNRTFVADLTPNNQVFAPGVKFVMGSGEPVPYDPLTFYHGVLVG